jgi:hypothetical protein
MHRVGFGDCFLVSFGYSEPLEDNRSERHVLIDFGTTSLPKGLNDLAGVAEEIRTRTGGEIDVVVLSHRHRDHLSAFGTANIASLLEATAPPKLVVRPWTEDPNAAETFTGGPERPGADSLAFVRSLADAHDFADAVAGRIATTGGRSLSGELHQLAFAQLSNTDAIAQLDSWASDKGEYLHYGMSTGIESLIPGVRVHVLGPPTIEQHAEVTSQRETDPEEFWMLYKQMVGALPEDVLHTLAVAGRDDPSKTPSVNGETTLRDLGPTTWLTNRLDRQQLGSFLRIVRVMDDVLNNTSLILLFEVERPEGVRRMLFGGDAQIENWEYALKVADVEENLGLLREVDLYKVGHHGSRNATPRTLFNLWTEETTIDHSLVAMMSTKAGVHGRHPETAVPRETLVTELKDRTRGAFLDSDELDGLWIEVSADMASSQPFVETDRG